MVMDSFSNDDLIELSLLREQEIDALVDYGFLSTERRFDDIALFEIDFSFHEMVLKIRTGVLYPAVQLSFRIDNLELPRDIRDALNTDLREAVKIDENTNCVERWLKREDDSYGVFEFEMTAFNLVQKIIEHLTTYRRYLSELSQREENDWARSQGLTPKDLTKSKNFAIADEGIDISTVQEDIKATTVLGRTVPEIVARMPPCLRILHVESVIRSDLYRRFLSRQQLLRETLQRRPQHELLQSIPIGAEARRRDVQTMAEFLARPKLTFHGTSNHYVPSIVRYGFLAPDELNPQIGAKNKVRCGSTYGRGIYSSPNANFALLYTGYDASRTTLDSFRGLKLIVCATLMGRSAEMCRTDNWREQKAPYPGADSHVANRALEYIVFEGAMILPCYVIHMDWGKYDVEMIENIPNDPKDHIKNPHPKLLETHLAPGDKQRQREALFAKASKCFPYGYGPAMGTSLVVEDVADVDEDEEEYGEYQEDRIEKIDKSTDIWHWENWEVNLEANEADEFTESRLEKKSK